ncbi:GNAT family N-acetyltransferase [Flavobacterium sp. '19STA2R22 D10 B1']|uniref:GNAT family N-acetyltransferase n=1 Tax=Flavobacterium aerium TaxID=3037261 RepID=UPI00278BEFDD|nr:GNAT family N-acetyltransferase [Flavobacterium sp. '19STA2R22 D10 B1']
MIITDRLILSRPEKSDVARYFEINSDPATNIFNPLGPLKNIEVAENIMRAIVEHWEKYNFGVWKISEIKNPEHSIGFGGLNYRMYGDELKLNLGFRFDVAFFGKGYATELAKRAITFAFEELEAIEVFGLVRPKNIASINVLEKCGFLLEGTLNDVPKEEESLVYCKSQ